jgi:hypothetical protein
LQAKKQSQKLLFGHSQALDAGIACRTANKIKALAILSSVAYSLILPRVFMSSLITSHLSAVGQTLLTGLFLIAASGAVLHWMLPTHFLVVPQADF